MVLTPPVWHTDYQLWASAFIGWFLTAVVRRHGGLRPYRPMRPVLLELVLGHCLVDAAMALVAAAVLGCAALPRWAGDRPVRSPQASPNQ